MFPVSEQANVKRAEAFEAQDTNPAHPIVDSTPSEDRHASPREAIANHLAAEHPQARQLSAAEVHFAVSFTRVLAVLMKSDRYRKMALGHIERFVAPPLLSGQFAIMDTQVNGQVVPVAVAFWAHVSPEVDARLSDTAKPAVLQPSDWRSGDIPWLVDVVGLSHAVPRLIELLREKTFAGREIKMRRKTARGGRR